MTPTHYRIEGLENRTIEVYLAGSDSPTQITLDAKGEAMQQAGVPVGIVARIACDGTQYEIGREESSQISLRIVDGKVAFREADDKGFIPVNTIAELKMIDLDDASRGANTSSRATSTCSTPSGRRSRNWRASMTAATSPSPASGFRSGTAMPGSSQPTAGRSATS